MNSEIIKHEGGAVEIAGAMTLKGVVDRVNIIHQVMEKVMKPGVHFGRAFGGSNKDVLLKPGADLLAMTFRLAPEYRVERHELPDGHREYEVVCIMRGPDGTVVGEGVGSASTMEKKYRYRKDGTENDCIADVYNTVLKISKKRAHVDATLTCTGASDMFTQDLIEEDEEGAAARPKPKRKPVTPPTPIDKKQEEIFGTIEDVEVKSGMRGEKEWTRFGIHIAGEIVGTFDKKIGEEAKANIGEESRITYTDDGKYKTAIGIEFGPDATPTTSRR